MMKSGKWQPLKKIMMKWIAKQIKKKNKKK